MKLINRAVVGFNEINFLLINKTITELIYETIITRKEDGQVAIVSDIFVTLPIKIFFTKVFFMN